MPTEAEDRELELLSKTARWSDSASRQINRFWEADFQYRRAVEDVAHRQRMREIGGEPSEDEEPVPAFTLRLQWQAADERYYLLLALGQVVKCAERLPKRSQVPKHPEGKTLRWLRDIEEHWEQEEAGRSLTKMRGTYPEAGPSRWLSQGGKRLWLHEELEVEDVRHWLRQVDEAVWCRSAALGVTFPDPSAPLFD